MLTNIRQWAHGWAAWIIIIFVAGIFIVWGISANIDMFMGSKDPAMKVVLKVGHDSFTQAQLDKHYQAIMAEYQQSLAGRAATLSPAEEARLKKMAEAQLVMESALNQFAAKEGFVIDKTQADAFIAHIPVFQENGQFSMERYQSFLAGRQQSPQDFLREIQQRLAFMQMSTTVGGSAMVLPKDIKEAVALIYQTRDVGYVEIDAKALEKDVKIDDKDIEAYYNGHHAEFTTPAQATIEYIVLDRSKIAEEVKKTSAPQDALRALYQERIESFTTPESRDIAHILIMVPENATEEERSAQKKKAEGILARFHEGADFATLAKENSEDPGSADQGGELGMSVKGTYEPSFDDAAFAAKTGEVIGPVETPFGYHLILVKKVEAAHAESFDKVQQTLADEWHQQQSAKQYDETIKALSDMAFQAGTDFAVMAKQFQLTPNTMMVSENMAENEGVGKMGEVVQAAFDKSAYQEQLNSELMQINPDESIVLRTVDLKESQLQPLEAVKDKARQAALVRKALRYAEDKASLMLRSFEAGSPPDFIANGLGLIWKPVNNMNRQSKDAPYEVVLAAFKMPMGDKRVFKMIPIVSGVAIVGVSAIHPGKMPNFSNTQEEQAFNENLRTQLGEFIARRDFDLFATYAKREIAPDYVSGAQQ